MTYDVTTYVGKSSIPSVNRPMDFHVIEYKKLIDMVSGSTLGLTCKKLPLLSFGLY